MQEPRPLKAIAADQFGRARTIFEAALEHPPASRAPWVREACGEDHELLAAVEAMLRADAAACPLLDGDDSRIAAGPLRPGVLFADHYRVTAFIGRGGMGDVYRAHDTALTRDVALKVLPHAVADDAAAGLERIARFRREAQLLAALNHPNIAAIYGLEESRGIQALALELVEGPTLADRLAAGSLPTDEALAIARQIAEALEAAHGLGIIHRDLKPANIKLRPDGRVKLLDFGLAKAVQSGVTPGGAVSASPTITSPSLMQRGVLLGTPAYMSPEQARGQEADTRGDIWAFGAVLYEMLSGQRVFSAEGVHETLAAVLHGEIDWTALAATTPPSVRRLLQRCLDRDARRRLRDIGEARIVLEDPAAASVGGEFDAGIGRAVTAPVARWRTLVVPVTAALLAAIVAGLAAWTAARPGNPPVVRFVVPTAGEHTLRIDPQSRDVAISPDGSRIVYKGGARGSATRLFVRELDRLEPTPVTSVGFPKAPFLSPDGTWLGYFEPGALSSTGPEPPMVTLKKVGLSGGTPTTLARIDGASRGATWGDDGTIVFATVAVATGLQRVPSAGGAPVVLTRPNRDEGEADHLWPHFLPGGRSILLTVTAVSGGPDASRLAVFNLETGRSKTVVRGASQGVYVPSGHLVYVVGNALWAVPFDLDRLETIGTAHIVVPDIVTLPTGVAEFDIGRDGALVYVTTDAQALRRELVWVDRQGREEPLGAEPQLYTAVRLSPDGTRVALEVADSRHDIWVFDLARRTLTPVTTFPGLDEAPVWTGDGKRLIFSSQAGGVAGALFWRAADGSGEAELLAEGPERHRPTSVLPDGSAVLFGGDADIKRLRLRDRVIEPVVQTPQGEGNAAVSPNGQWIAYDSNDTGPFEVFVRPYPNTREAKYQVSTNGGSKPVWARNGRELFFLSPDGTLMSVPVPPGTDWTRAIPAPVLERPYVTDAGATTSRTYDVSPDGQRFLMIKQAGGSSPAMSSPAIVVVQHWIEELERLVPVKQSGILRWLVK